MALVRRIVAPPAVPAEVKTGLVVPVMAELMVSVFAPLWMKNSEAEEVIRPRVLALVVAPMTRFWASEPASKPPEARVSVSSVVPVKETVVAPWRVRELIVRSPVGIVVLAARRRLLVDDEAANVVDCSSRLRPRIPAPAS